MRILYLGIDPSRYFHRGTLTHFPIIKTVPIQCVGDEWRSYSHLLFTSPSAVKHWFSLVKEPLHSKTVLSIGSSTSALLASHGHTSIQAPYATQEGVIALLQTLSIPSLFWPRSALARPLLAAHLKKRQIPHQILDLYTTVAQVPGPLPNLDDFDEIVFTSPSTVDAFLEIFGKIPKEKKITPIGPVSSAKIVASV